MAVGNMHIRHDYKTWVDWPQVSVRSLCGVTTRRHLAGIPGVTQQPDVIGVGEKKVWGWCTRCVACLVGDIQSNVKFTMHKDIEARYSAAYDAVYDQYLWYRKRQVRV